MKRTAIIVALLAIAAPLLAQEDAIPKDFQYGEFSLGLIQKDIDTNSSKYLEYRDIPNGVVAPIFSLEGAKTGFRYRLYAEDLTQNDGRYGWDLQKSWFRFSGFYSFIPHAFGNGAKSLENNTAEGVFLISNILQTANQAAILAVPRPSVNFAFLNNLVTPSLAAAPFLDLNYKRQRSNGLVRLSPSDNVEIKAGYFNELRKGYRGGAGTAFGFGNVVETPDQTRYTTEDVGADIEFRGSWGVARAGLHYNWFRDRIPTLAFDNPFRATNTTDASAYQSPGSASVNGPAFAVVAQPPDNNAVVGSAATSLKLGKKSRVYADFSYGSWTQDSTPFIAYSTNSAINPSLAAAIRPPFDTTNPANLPARQLDGKINVTSFNAAFNTRPTDKLTFNVRYRLYDLANDTSRISQPGYVRFDAVWESIPRISVPYAYKNNRFDATLAYDLGKVTLEAGYKWTDMDRHFRETEKTKENGFIAAADIRFSDKGTFRGSYEFGSRDFEGLEIELSEEASFQVAGVPANLLAVPTSSPTYASFGCGTAVCNLRYDQSARDFNRISALLQLTPQDKWALNFSYFYNKSDYKDTRYGLTEAKYGSFTAEADFTPSDKWNLYVFYTYENQKDFQRGRQSGATVSAIPLDDWTSAVDDKVNSVGGGANFTLVPEKWTLGLFGRWQDVNGNNDFFAPPGGVPANARTAVGGVQDIAAYDDLKVVALSGELKYQFAKKWAFALGGAFEDYNVDDANTEGLIYYFPGSFFLNGNNGDYQAKWGYVRLIYNW